MCDLLSYSFACTKKYVDSRYKEEDFPVTNQLVKEVLSLQCTLNDDEQIKYHIVLKNF
jgi:hypothetical protein